MDNQKERRYRLDAFRVYAIFLVIIGHIEFRGDLPNDTTFSLSFFYFMALTARWIIPYFFILAGYFMGGKVLRQPQQMIPIAQEYTKKLILIFLFWCLVYTIEDPIQVYNFARSQPFTFILQGSKIHLWYLVSLILTSWLFVLWPFDKKSVSFLIFGFILFIVGLLGGSYKHTPLGFDIGMSTRNGIFFSTFFFALGVWINQNPLRISKLKSLGIAAVGLAIYDIETFLLRSSMDMRQHDFLLGSIPFALGIFLYALNSEDQQHDRVIGRFGKYVLGIYVCHFLFIPLWQPLGKYFGSDIWPLVFPILVFVTSLLFTMVLSKTPLRRFVM